MLAQITREDLLEWAAYAELEPFDETRADYRAAQLAKGLAMVAAKVHAIASGLGIPAHVADRPLQEFVLRFGAGRAEAVTRQQTPEQARLILRTMALAHATAEQRKQLEAKWAAEGQA